MTKFSIQAEGMSSKFKRFSNTYKPCIALCEGAFSVSQSLEVHPGQRRWFRKLGSGFTLLCSLPHTIVSDSSLTAFIFDKVSDHVSKS